MSVGSVQHLTNGAYGFPRGQVRRIKPVALACIHITGNSRTAAYTDLHAAAQAERNYANRSDSRGPSAHDYVARDGWAIEGIDWRRYAAWSNGDVSSPNTANPGIRRVLAMRAKGYNANEAYWLEFENVGYGSRYPVLAAQRQHCAERIAAAAAYSALPINRETVHGHWEINGVDRQGCPSPSHESFLNDVIQRARAVTGQHPHPEPEEPMIPGHPTDGGDGVVTLKEGRGLFDIATGGYIVPTDRVKTSHCGWHLIEPDNGDPNRQDGYLVRHAQRPYMAFKDSVDFKPASSSGSHTHSVVTTVDGQIIEGTTTHQ